jgi:hypothetical protein
MRRTEISKKAILIGSTDQSGHMVCDTPQLLFAVAQSFSARTRSVTSRLANTAPLTRFSSSVVHLAMVSSHR